MYWRPPPRRLVDTSAVAIFAVALGLGAGVLIRELIGAAWIACDQAEAGAYLTLTFVIAPITAVLVGLALGVGFVGLHRAPTAQRLQIGSTLAVVICLVAFSVVVPVYGEDAYGSGPPTPDLPECGPRGIPTWWPTWLPS